MFPLSGSQQTFSERQYLISAALVQVRLTVWVELKAPVPKFELQVSLSDDGEGEGEGEGVGAGFVTGASLIGKGIDTYPGVPPVDVVVFVPDDFDELEEDDELPLLPRR